MLEATRSLRKSYVLSSFLWSNISQWSRSLWKYVASRLFHRIGVILIERKGQFGYPITSILVQMEEKPINGVLEDFRISFLECWQKLPNKAFFFLLLAAWMLLFLFLGNPTLGYVKSASL